MDEALLQSLDADPAVKQGGRSAAIREAVGWWLRRRAEARIEAAYRRGYGAAAAPDAVADGLGPDWDGWENQGVWPEK